MGTGYTRNDTTNNIADGNVINAADLDGEFDAIVTALGTGGHTHDGTAAEGGPVTVLGPAQDFVVTASIVSPKTDNTLDLGTSTLEFKDLFIDGTAYIDGLGEDLLVAGTSKIQFTNTSNYIHSASAGNIDLVAATEIHLTATTINMDGAADISGNLGVGGNLTVTGTTTFNGGTVTLGDAATDNVVFGADVNSSIIPNGVGGSFDLGSAGQEWRDIYINGSAYIDGLAEDILVATNKKVQFRDTGLFINSSTNGQLDIDADVELEITAPTVDINASTAVLISNDLKLDSDAAVLSFGASSEVTITHVADTGLTLTHTGTGDNTPIVLQLKSEENAVIADEVLGSIEFAAGDDSGTDGATVAAGIHAIAEAEFTASANATKLVFTTGVSETAAASATAKMTLSSAGLLTIADDFMLKDGGTIGVASTNDAITIASTGIVTFKDDILIKDAGTIGVASTAGAITIASDGDTTFSADVNVGANFDVTGNAVIDGTAIVSGQLTVTGDSIFNGANHTFTGTASSKPFINLISSANDALSSQLRFTKDRGAAGVDGDDIGLIDFFADNSNQEQTRFAAILAEVSESNDGDEAGKLSFFVSESNGTSAQLTAGLVIEGEHATDGEVDVTIAAGTASTTTVAGTLAVTGIATFTDDIIIGDGKTIGSASTVGAITIASDGDLALTGVVTANAGVVVDEITIDADTITASDDFIIDAVGEIVLDADSQGSANGVQFKDDGTHYGSIFRNDSDLNIKSIASDKDIVFLGVDSDGGGEITALKLDMSAAGSATFSHNIFLPDAGELHFGAGGDLKLTSDGTNGSIIAPNGNLTLDIAGNIELNTDSGLIALKDASVHFGSLFNSASDFFIASTTQDKDIKFQGMDGNTTLFTMLQLDASDAGSARFRNGTEALPSISNLGDTNTGIFFESADVLGVSCAGSRRLRISADGTMLHQASNNTIMTHESTNNANVYIQLKNTNNDRGFLGYEGTTLAFYNSDGTNAIRNLIIEEDGDLNVTVGNVVIGTAGKGIDFSATANQGVTTPNELLDDYEEGTFTPTLTNGFSGSGPTSYNLQKGGYTRVGNKVTAQIELRPQGATGNASLVQIAGLPYTSAGADPNGYGGAFLSYNDGFSTITGFTLHLPSGNSVLQFYLNTGAAMLGNASGVNINKQIIVSVVYLTS